MRAGRALGGGALNGDRIERLVYLDESGTGNPKTEPHVVMVGVVVDPDRQWLQVESFLSALAEQYVLPHRRSVPVVFHANEIFHGSGHWPREEYSREVRMNLLRELCSIPVSFDLPVVSGYVDRTEVARHLPDDDVAEQTLYATVGAAMRCTVGVERYMRTAAGEGEVATLVYENNDHSRKLIRKLHNAMKTDAMATWPTFQNWELREFLPVTRIVDTAHFAEKLDTSILQVADACAFAIRRFLAGKPEGDVDNLPHPGEVLRLAAVSIRDEFGVEWPA